MSKNLISSKTKNRFAGAAGFIVGLLSLLSGSAVLLGIKQPDYTVLHWLVTYNTIMGVVAMGAGIGIWSAQPWGARLTSLITIAHFFVLLVLCVVYVATSNVALQSIAAMTFRSIAWAGITLTVWKNK